ncbi:dihydroorotase [Alteribacter natronophilus]|uniref:dihydroorotase n=1 Tax=Alteribacter natronophilus TaxID=2583810 RepID=UPI00110D294F|nr:dihydroorotase [Alteribacter natronophilus]TMW73148.1 dihydroorotase [Alteribacter natronophilus]
MKTVYKNAMLVNSETTVSLVVNEDTGTIESITQGEVPAGDRTVDLKGMLVTPGFVDIHVHLREPGGEAKETIATGTHAAAKGGFTTVAAMPNTRPVPDSRENVSRILEKIDTDARIRVLPYGSITVREAGRELSDFDGIAESVLAFTDDGVGVQEAGRMFEAMKKAAGLNKAVVAHCEDNSLINGGSVHKGEISETLNIPGIPSICESVHIARDVLLAEAAGAHYHVCHVSTKESVRVIRDAKKAGIHVTAEVTPHHLVMSENDIPGNDANYKMNPPLRSEEDRRALIEGLLDGTIDTIATDHAPHTKEEKSQPMEESPFGITGLELAFPLLYTKMVKTGQMNLGSLVSWLTEKPADVFQLPYGRLKEGGPAEFTVIDLEKAKQVAEEDFVSKGTNTPFMGERLTGWPVLTVFDGKQIWKEGE